MEIPVFQVPSFLSDQDTDTTHQRMLEGLPGDLDTMPGSDLWDMTRPVAIEKAELLEFHLPQTLRLMFWMWAYGKWLDYHAWRVGLTRRAATHASGYLQITGTPGAVIPQGYSFATAAVNDVPSREVVLREQVTIGADGTATLLVQAADAGVAGNVAAGTVTLMLKPMKEILSVTNPSAITGGTEEEEDEELRQRIALKHERLDSSFVGCDRDYVLWAQEVDGVGAAVVIPTNHGPNSLTLVILDANGAPASPTMLEAVYNHIMSPDNRMERKAPIGAVLYVAAPTTVEINYSATILLEAGRTAEEVETGFRDALEDYYIELQKSKVDGVSTLKYIQVWSTLAAIPGLKDFRDLLVDGDTNNISFDATEFPFTGAVKLKVVDSLE